MKILVAIDGSASTPRLFDYLAAHPELFGGDARIDVLYVVEPLPHRAAAHATLASTERLYEEDGERVLGEIGPLLERRGIAARLSWRIGRPAQAIASVAESHDVVVLGSRGRGPLANVVLGSVATEVLARSRTPVLVVP